MAVNTFTMNIELTSSHVGGNDADDDMFVLQGENTLCVSQWARRVGEVHRAYIGQCCCNALIQVNNFFFHHFCHQHFFLLNKFILIYHPSHYIIHDRYLFSYFCLGPSQVSLSFHSCFSSAGSTLIRKKLGDRCFLLCPKHSTDKKG